MKIRALLASALAWAVALVPAHAMAEGTYKKSSGGGVTELPATSLPATGDSKLIYRITNATNGGDCDNVGGGTEQADCRWNGSTYEPIASGVAGISAVADDSAPVLGGNLNANTKNITGMAKIGARNFWVRTDDELRAAESACGQDMGQTANPTGCNIYIDVPDLEINTAANGTLELAGLGGEATGNVALKIFGYGGGLSGNIAGDAGTRIHGNSATTLVRVGACINCGMYGVTVDGENVATKGIAFTGGPNVGWEMKNSGVVNIAGTAIEGPGTCTDVYNTPAYSGSAHAQTSGSADGWCDSDAITHVSQWDTALFENVIVRNSQKCLHLRQSQSVGIVWRNSSCTQMIGTGPFLHAQYGELNIEDSYVGIGNADNAIGAELSDTGSSLNVQHTRFEYPDNSSNPDVDGVTAIRCAPATNGEHGVVLINDNKFVYSSGGNNAIDCEKRGAVTITNNIALNSLNSPGVTTGMLVERDDGHADDHLKLTLGGNVMRDGYSAGSDFPKAWNPTVTLEAGLEVSEPPFASPEPPESCQPWQVWIDTNASPAPTFATCSAGNWVVQGAAGDSVLVDSTPVTEAGGINLVSGLGMYLNPLGNDPLDLAFQFEYGASYNFGGGAEQCVFTETGSGAGGFVCEGQTPNAFQYKFTFPLMPEVAPDAEKFIALASTGITDALSAATAASTYQAKSGLTASRCLRTDGSGNIVVAAGDCLNGDTGGGGGAVVLDDLTDVVITTPATGAPIFFDGTNWLDGALNLADSDAVSGELPDANVANNITASNYLPLAGGTISGSVNLGSGVTLNVQTGAAISSSGGGIVATGMAGGGTIDNDDLAIGAVDGGAGGEIEDGTITADDLGPNSLTAADAAADLATQLELDAKTLPGSGLTDNRLVRTDLAAGDVQQSGVTVDDSNNVTGVNDLTAAGAITGASVDTSAPAGTGQSTQTWQEGVTHGSDTLVVSSPAGGFAANRTCTLEDDNTPYDGCITPGGGGGAPTDASYFVGAANGTLSAEVVAGTGVATAFAINVGSAGAFVTNGGALGTPSSGNASNLTNIPAANLTGSIDLGTGTIRGAVSVESTTSASHTLASAEGQWLFADEGSTTTVTLPALSAGAAFCVYPQTDQRVILDPNASQVIVLDGTALAGGNKIQSPAAGGNAGNFACLLSNGTSWYVLGKAGAWADGGP